MTHAHGHPEAPPAMTDLESRLLADDGAAQRASLQGRLMAIEARLRGDMAAGMPRADYPAWQHALDAVVAARAVVDHLPPAPAGPPPSSLEGLYRRAP